MEWSKSGKRPSNFPSAVSDFYKEEFEGYPEFLGYVSTRSSDKKFMDYREAKECMKKIGLKSQKEFKE